MSHQATNDLMSTEEHYRIIKTAFVELYKKSSTDAYVKNRIQHLLHYDKMMSKTLPADNVIFEKCVEVSRKKQAEWGLPYALTNDPDTRTKYSRKIKNYRLKLDIIEALKAAHQKLPEELHEYNLNAYEAAQEKMEAKKALKRLGN